MQVNQLKRTEAILQRPKTPPKRGDFTVHGGQVCVSVFSHSQARQL